MSKFQLSSQRKHFPKKQWMISLPWSQGSCHAKHLESYYLKQSSLHISQLSLVKLFTLNKQEQKKKASDNNTLRSACDLQSKSNPNMRQHEVSAVYHKVRCLLSWPALLAWKSGDLSMISFQESFPQSRGSHPCVCARGSQSRTTDSMCLRTNNDSLRKMN